MDNKLLKLFEDTRICEISENVKRRPISQKNYIICFTPRSSSTWLTNLIHKTNSLGNPNEWFNPNSIEGLVREYSVKNILEYVDTIRRMQTSSTGIFGVEVSYFQLKMALELLSIEQIFGDMPIWFYLTRQDFVLQGISLYLAIESGYFHSYQKTNNEYKNYLTVEYNAEKIQYWCSHILEQETGFEKIFHEYYIEPIRFTYEKLSKSPERILQLFHNVLNVRFSQVPQDESIIKKLSDSRNLEWKKRFTSEKSDFLAEFENKRSSLAPY